MASESSIRCKRWREKRKDDEDYWNQERSRKREARRTRSDEKKQHDRELSKKRQKRYRDRKKQIKNLVLEIDGATAETGTVTERVSSGPNSADILTSFSVPESASMPTEYDSITDSNYGTGDTDSPLRLRDIHTDRSAKVTAPQMNPMQNMEGEADFMNNNFSRQAYFETIQTVLSEIEDFNSIKSRCNSISQFIEQTYPIHDLPSLDVGGYHLDNVALSLYPLEDSPSNLVPIHTVADGNCLPRVGSLFAFGDEKRHVEMRVRIFMELCLFEDNYLDDSYLNRGAENHVENLAMTLAQYSFDEVLIDKHKCREVFRRHVKATLQANTFNGMWSIFALASVLGVKIFSIYPSYGGYNVRPHLHRQVMPRICRHESNRTVHIMWTHTQGKEQSPLTWNPNHFVAVLPAQELTHSPVIGKSIGPTVHTIQIDTDQTSEDMSTHHMDTTSNSRHKEEVESPSFITLQSMAADSTVLTMGAGPERTSPLETGQYNPMAQTLPASEASVDGMDAKRRHEDRCQSHPSEELVYLCMTCSALPVCYKCHLRGHERHNLTDLKECLAEAETVYANKVTVQRQQLKGRIKRQKLDHEQNKQRIDREIDDMHEFYKEQLITWVSNQRAHVRDRNQNVRRQILDIEAQLENPDFSAENKILDLRKLPVSQRLSVMSGEPRLEPLSDRFPCTTLAFRDRPAQLLTMLGTLAEIPYHSDRSTKEGSRQATYESGPLLPPDEDKNETHTEGFRRLSKWDEDMELFSGTSNNGLNKTNILETRFKGLGANISSTATSAQNDQTWIHGSTETLTNKQQQSPCEAQGVQTSSYSGSVVPSLNGRIRMINSLSPIQDSTGTKFNESETMQNQGHVTFPQNTTNEHEFTTLNMSPLIKGKTGAYSIGRTDYNKIGLHHHIHSSSADIATEPSVMTTSKQRHHEPCFPGLQSMGPENNRNNGGRQVISNDVLSDQNGQSVTLPLKGRLTISPSGTLINDDNVVRDFVLPFSIERLVLFKPADSMLYIYDGINRMLSKVSKYKSGVIQETIVLSKEGSVHKMCVLPVDYTVWLISYDGIVRRMDSSKKIEERFKVPDSCGILVTSSGDVLVLKRIDYIKCRLILYTTTGQVINSIVLNNCSELGFQNMKECPQTHDIAICYCDPSWKIIIIDSLLTLSREIEMTGERRYGFDDFCFDRRGHVLVCSDNSVDMFDHRTCVYMRTVLIHSSLEKCILLYDVDEDNILWVLYRCGFRKRVRGYRLPSI